MSGAHQPENNEGNICLDEGNTTINHTSYKESFMVQA
jgi:hypothetical protein